MATSHRYDIEMSMMSSSRIVDTLQWRHNECGGVSNQRRLGCLLNRLFRRRSKKMSMFRVTGLCEGIHRWSVNSPHKWPVTRKMFFIWWRHHETISVRTHLADSPTERNKNTDKYQKKKWLLSKFMHQSFYLVCKGICIWCSCQAYSRYHPN